MNIFDAVVLGFVQGLTEFLPISSSAHVQLVQQLLGLGSLDKAELTAFIATIQLGTELAVLVYFWRDIVRIGKGFLTQGFRAPNRQSAESKMGWMIIIGTLPIVALGLIFKDQIETDLRNLWVAGVALIVFGLLLGVSDKISKSTRGIDQIKGKDAVLFGLGQALALIPGVSRSGGTITVGRLLGFSRQSAARYSFLLAIPAVLASGILEFAGSYKDLSPNDLVATIVATVVAFAVGFSVIVALLRYLNRGSFLPFVIWRVVVGSAILVMLSTGMLSA